MKIPKQSKGFVDYSEEYNPIIPEYAYYEPSEEDVQALEAQHDAEVREQEENAIILKEWEEVGQRNLEIIRDIPGAIGERLKHLFEQKKIERIHFARQIGVSRSTLFRYCEGTSTPSKKRLLIIIDALDMDVADFCYEPKNYEKWKAVLEEKATRKNDIFTLRDNLLERLSRNNFTFQHKGETTRLPYRHYVILKAMLESSFRILDLIPHDSEEQKAKQKDTPKRETVTKKPVTEADDK